MGKSKKSKSSLTEKDKQFIREMKEYLKMMGIPREEWSKIIQTELKNQKRFKSFKGLLGQDKEEKGIFGKVKNKIGKVVNKVAAKRMGMDADALEQMADMFGNPFDSMEGGGNLDMMNPFFPKVDFEDVDELGSDGATFVMDRPDKKRMIVEFDDED